MNKNISNIHNPIFLHCYSLSPNLMDVFQATKVAQACLLSC